MGGVSADGVVWEDWVGVGGEGGGRGEYDGVYVCESGGAGGGEGGECLAVYLSLGRSRMTEGLG